MRIQFRTVTICQEPLKIQATRKARALPADPMHRRVPNGKLMVVGAAFDPIEVTPIQLIDGSPTIQGWASGTPVDSEDTMRFAELAGIRPMIETYPLEKTAEAYARMMSGDARFRVVLTT